MHRIFRGATVALALAAAAPSLAATVDMVGDHAISIRGLAFEGRVYDANFSSAGFDAVRSAEDSPFPFLGRSFADLSPLIDAVTTTLGAAGAVALGDPAAGTAFPRGVIATRTESVLDVGDFVGVDIGLLGAEWMAFGGVALDKTQPVGAANRALMVFREVAPVPLPAPGLLLAAGLGALGLRRMRDARPRKHEDHGGAR